MKERPILLNTLMVRAVLNDRKTRTRRPIKPQPPHMFGQKSLERIARYQLPADCPMGLVGDRLYVRETFAVFKGDVFYKADGHNNARIEQTVGWKPSIHMPKKYSRIKLEIIEVKAEMVHEISEEDAMDEGYYQALRESPGEVGDPVPWFHQLWDSIYSKQGFGWDSKAWVDAVEFKQIS